MNRGYTFLWRKVWANPLLCEPGRKFSRLEAWLYLINVLAAGMDDEAAGLKRGEFGASSRYLARKWRWARCGYEPRGGHNQHRLRSQGAAMKPGDQVIWLYSKKRSFLTGWRLQRVPGVSERVCRARIRIRVRLGDKENVLNVVPENVISETDVDDATTMPS
jgi:hypothetical protein